jgi:hypothetical protein
MFDLFGAGSDEPRVTINNINKKVTASADVPLLLL